MTDETRERILVALHKLLADNELETNARRSGLAFLRIGTRRKALQDAITIVRNTP
jgi:hypothetical protein